MQLRLDYRFIFVHIPKTAGTSIEGILTALPPRPIPLDLRVAHRLYRATTGRRYRPVPKHAKAMEIRRWVGHYAWHRSFSFAVIRNPWDLMVSSYFWWLQKSQKWDAFRGHTEKIKAMKDFREFMQSEYGQRRLNLVETDLMDYLTDQKGKCIVDFIARFERLEEDWATICGKIALKNPGLQQLNKSERQDYHLYYDQASRDVVAKRFERYIDQFGYTFD
jgi:hypothetical protein